MNFHLLLKIFDENVKCVEDEKMIVDQNQLLRLDIFDFSVKNENIDQRVCKISIFMLFQSQSSIIYV